MTATGNVRTVPPSRFWLLGLGFGLWCTAIAIIYSLHALGCAFGWRTDLLRWSLGLVLLAHLVAIGWPWYRAVKTPAEPALGETGEFLRSAYIWTLGKAFVALLLTLGPILLLATCL
jgi:hypothetical protein